MTAMIRIFEDAPTIAEKFAQHFVELLESLAQHQDTVTVSLSGGSTPKLLFTTLSEQYANHSVWSQVHFFWGDERCVPATDPESNFGVADELFLSKIGIPPHQIHRVRGESDPRIECERYAQELREHVAIGPSGFPALDILLLGLGSDGHTASIFPNQKELLNSDQWCAVATHPESGQSRITLTGQVLNAAKSVFFLVTGASKSQVLFEILNKSRDYQSYPASFIQPQTDPIFYLDKQAAALLDR